MKELLKWGVIVMVLVASVSLGGNKAQEPNPIKRVGMVVGIKPDKIAEYKRLHADNSPSVRDLLNRYHMHNFSIFLHEIDGRWYEFGYYEYTGDDFDGDMAKLAAEPRNQAWLKVCDPMQIPLKGQKTWATMERVFYNP
jgi:L-rhamnose mutarotase